MDAAAKVKAKFEADAEFKEIVLALLPDLGYETFGLGLGRSCVTGTTRALQSLKRLVPWTRPTSRTHSSYGDSS